MFITPCGLEDVSFCHTRFLTENLFTASIMRFFLDTDSDSDSDLTKPKLNFSDLSII